MDKKKRFVAYFYFNGFDHVSFGVHFCWSAPNIEIHLTFGFFRIGWTTIPYIPGSPYGYKLLYRSFGWE